MVIELENCSCAHNTGERVDECCPCGVLMDSLQGAPVLDASKMKTVFVCLNLIATCIAFPCSATYTF